jgi:small subunit ribosomal protein S7
VNKFIGNIMRRGKRTLAQRILYEAFEIIEKKGRKPALEIFNEAIKRAKPKVETKSRRIGGATYQVPVEILPERQTSLAIRWIISFAKKRGEKRMAERLAGEFLDIVNNTGATLKKRSEVHKMAEANRAFAHYRW